MLLIVIMLCFYLIVSYLTETVNCTYTNMSKLCGTTTAGILYNMNIITLRRQFLGLSCKLFGNFTIHIYLSLYLSSAYCITVHTVFIIIVCPMQYIAWDRILQESPAVADKPARRESLPKIAPIRRAYNVVADNTGLSSFV